MQKKLLILAVVALVLIGGVVLMWEKKSSQEASQNETNQGASEDLLMSLNLDGSKNYRSEKYGFEVVVPKDQDLFRDVEIENRENGHVSINFIFETKDSRYFNEYNCQGKCVPMFFVQIFTHEEFNSDFQERFVSSGNLSGKSPVILVNDQYVFSGASMAYFASDPPSDLINLKNDLSEIYQSFKSL